MGHLDRRTADEEDGRSARAAAEQHAVSYEQQLHEAEAQAERTAAQEALVEEVHELVEQFLELMEEQDYPHLTTIELPMTRWWWPFPRNTRKAVWTLFRHNGEKKVTERTTYINDETECTYTWYERVHLLPDGELMYHLTPGFGSGYNQEKAAFHEWDGERAKELKEMLGHCISFLKTGRSEDYWRNWPPAYVEKNNL